jgi:hypothetical protein
LVEELSALFQLDFAKEVFFCTSKPKSGIRFLLGRTVLTKLTVLIYISLLWNQWELLEKKRLGCVNSWLSNVAVSMCQPVGLTANIECQVETLRRLLTTPLPYGE